MGLSSPGVGSGLDVNGIVSQLLAIEKRPLLLLQSRQAEVQNRISAYGKVKSQLDALKGALAALAPASAWSGRAASVADPAIAAASAGATAAPGDYALEVTQLAQAHRLVSDPYAAATDAVGLGTLTLEVGTWTGASFAARAGSAAATVTVDGSNNTLAGVRDAINAAGTDVRGSIVTDASGARLVLASAATGAGSAIRVGVAGDAGLAKLLYAGDTTPAAPGLKQARAAVDARLEIDGVPVTSASNAVAGALEGVTLTLLGTNAGAPTTVRVAPDTDAARRRVDDFVATYNASVKLLAELTRADPAGRANGALQGDSAARSISTALRALASRLLPSGTLRSLSQAGIRLAKDGTLAVDASAYAAVTAGGLADLGNLFSATGTGEAEGIAVRFDAALGTALGTNGAIEARTTGLATTLKANQRAQEAQNTRLATVEDRLRRQYGALDANLARLQGTSSALTQGLAQLLANQNAKG